MCGHVQVCLGRVASRILQWGSSLSWAEQWDQILDTIFLFHYENPLALTCKVLLKFYNKCVDKHKELNNKVLMDI